jgi:hypothetical protein
LAANRVPDVPKDPMSNSEITFSPESDEAVDSEAFSGFSLLGLIASVIGVLSIQYVHFMPLAIVGTLLGMFVLLFSKKYALSQLSRTFGLMAVFIGATTNCNKLAKWPSCI